MKPVEVTENVYCLPAIDWNIRDFHGYSTHQGTTYNAYLIMDEKVTLIDTVKKEFVNELMDGISQLVDPKKIDYVISNHTEMDHSGGLPRIMHRIGEDKPLFCSKVGYKNLRSHYPQEFNYQAVENLGELNLGEKTLTFMETRMLHWPSRRAASVPTAEADFRFECGAGCPRSHSRRGSSDTPYCCAV